MKSISLADTGLWAKKLLITLKYPYQNLVPAIIRSLLSN